MANGQRLIIESYDNGISRVPMQVRKTSIAYPIGIRSHRQNESAHTVFQQIIYPTDFPRHRKTVIGRRQDMMGRYINTY